MTALYWGLEFIKVTLCYIFILFIWPSVVFRKFLRTKSKIYWFCFCATTQIVLYNTVVIGLGLVHLLNPWIINILFYGVLLFSIKEHLIPSPSLRNDMRKLLTGTLSLRGFLLAYWTYFISQLKKLCGIVWRQIRHRLIESIILTVFIVYGIMYFSYSPFMDHSYGFGDMYTHHSWIYGLIKGQIFSAGVYPEGMHCIVYMMHTTTGLTVYNCNLFLGCIHIAVYILAVYSLMREIFRWRGTPLCVITVFLVLSANSYDVVLSMARLQRTLPGDYGLHTVFICALYLLKFLKEDIKKDWHKHPKEWLKNENLIVFSMALSASIAVHFYVTIIAFFVCFSFAMVYIVRTLTLKRFVPLAAAVICGFTIAVLPMVGALLSGIQFQGSIDWAMSIMSGEITESTVGGAQTPELPEIELPGIDLPGNMDPSSPDYQPGVMDLVRLKIAILIRYGYGALVGEDLGPWMALTSVLVAVFCGVFRLICLTPRLRPAADTFDNYLPALLASLAIMVLYAAPFLSIPELISFNRLPSTAYMLLLIVAGMPVDILFTLPQRFFPNWLMQVVSLACVAGISAASIATGHYHGYLYNELTRYRSAVNVTSSITKSFPENSYTVVSSTDELYSVIQYGRHEELMDFIKANERGESFYLPTEYVFIYVEKNPIVHAQYHFSSGPRWLATDTYADTYIDFIGASKYPEIFSTQIDDSYTPWLVSSYITSYDSYRNPFVRTVVNSKAYKWCQDFAALYDHELKVYYEDDDLICYYFRQNTYSLYDLAIWSPEIADTDTDTNTDTNTGM